MARGRVLRFDHAKGYGFIAPDGGGEDVFLHVNDLVRGEKHLLGPGAIVEYDQEFGDRGAKASAVQIEMPAPGRAPMPAPHGPSLPLPEPSSEPDEEFVDVLPQADFQREVTELLLRIDPGLTGPQIRATRDQFARLAKKYGWMGS